MDRWSPSRQGYSLPGASALARRTSSPVSASNVGNTFAIPSAQSVSVSVESGMPRTVSLRNIGSVDLVVTDTQRVYPYGLRLPAGELVQLTTSSALWVVAPPCPEVGGETAVVASIGYVSVSNAL